MRQQPKWGKAGALLKQLRLGKNISQKELLHRTDELFKPRKLWGNERYLRSVEAGSRRLGRDDLIVLLRGIYDADDTVLDALLAATGYDKLSRKERTITPDASLHTIAALMEQLRAMVTSLPGATVEQQALPPTETVVAHTRDATGEGTVEPWVTPDDERFITHYLLMARKGRPRPPDPRFDDALAVLEQLYRSIDPKNTDDRDAVRNMTGEIEKKIEYVHHILSQPLK